LAQILLQPSSGYAFDADGRAAARHRSVHRRVDLDFRNLGRIAAQVGAQRARALLDPRTADRQVEVEYIFKGRHYRPRTPAQLIVLARALRLAVRDADVGPDALL